MENILQIPYTTNQFKVWNMQNNEWKVTGVVNNQYSESESPIFIGGTTNIPDNTKFTITFTGNTDPEEADGTIQMNM